MFEASDSEFVSWLHFVQGIVFLLRNSLIFKRRDGYYCRGNWTWQRSLVRYQMCALSDRVRQLEVLRQQIDLVWPHEERFHGVRRIVGARKDFQLHLEKCTMLKFNEADHADCHQRHVTVASIVTDQIGQKGWKDSKFCKIQTRGIYSHFIQKMYSRGNILHILYQINSSVTGHRPSQFDKKSQRSHQNHEKSQTPTVIHCHMTHPILIASFKF